MEIGEVEQDQVIDGLEVWFNLINWATGRCFMLASGSVI